MPDISIRVVLLDRRTLSFPSRAQSIPLFVAETISTVCCSYQSPNVSCIIGQGGINVSAGIPSREEDKREQRSLRTAGWASVVNVANQNLRIYTMDPK